MRRWQDRRLSFASVASANAYMSLFLLDRGISARALLDAYTRVVDGMRSEKLS